MEDINGSIFMKGRQCGMSNLAK